MAWQEHITINLNKPADRPIVAGSRISPEQVADLLTGGWSVEQLTQHFPTITVEDIHACLEYATRRLHPERIFPLAS